MTQGRPYSLAINLLEDKAIPTSEMIPSAQVSQVYYPKLVYGTAIITLDIMREKNLKFLSISIFF